MLSETLFPLIAAMPFLMFPAAYLIKAKMSQTDDEDDLPPKIAAARDQDDF
jgi:hypothetical protein